MFLEKVKKVTTGLYQNSYFTKIAETSYTSPSQLSFYTKMHASSDGRYLASGSEEQQVQIFKTVSSSKIKAGINTPIHSLVHEGNEELAVCCPVFSPHDDLIVSALKLQSECYILSNFYQEITSILLVTFRIYCSLLLAVIPQSSPNGFPKST
jgi:WD40 repeat protein